jgi:hypothetical protein
MIIRNSGSDDTRKYRNCFRQLLDQILNSMPNLRRLTLANPSSLPPYVNVTDFVVAMLRLSPESLSYLSVDGFNLDQREHYNLRSYKNNDDTRIRYYSTLNRYGRSAAQNPWTSYRGFVEHLIDMLGDDMMDEIFKSYQQLWSFARMPYHLECCHWVYTSFLIWFVE